MTDLVKIALTNDELANQVVRTVTRQLLGGIQVEIHFANGFGASVINHTMSYGVELAVLDHGMLTYDTPITDDVIGFLDAETLRETLLAIAAL